MAWRVRGGELPLSQTLVDPELHYGQISTTQKDGTPPFPRRNAHSRTLCSTWSLLLDAQSSCVVLWVVLGLVRCLRWNMGMKLGRSQLHVRPVGRFSRARTVATSLLSRLDAAETPHLPCLDGQVWFPGATHRAIKRCQKVWRQSWRTARNLIRLGTKCWVNSLGVMWEQHCRPLWAPVRPASRCRILLVSLLQVSMPLSLVGLLAYFSLCKAYRALFVSKLALIVRYLMDSANLVEKDQYKRLLHTSHGLNPLLARSLHKLVIPELNRCHVQRTSVHPSKPVFSSSSIEVTSEHAVISCFSAESLVPVQGTSCVDRAVSHGFDGTVSGGTCGKDTSPAHHARSQPGVGTQFAHVGYPRVDFAVEAVVPGFPAESSAVSHGVDVAMSGGSCGKGTSPAYLARSQPGVGTQCAHVGYPGVELVSRATYISRKKRNLETVQRQSKALKKAQRDAKRKFIAQPEICHEAVELILRNQAARTDDKFPGTIHVSHHLALLHGHENVFFCAQCGAVNAGGALRVLQSQCDGSGESRQKARRKLERGLMPNEHVIGRCKARILVCAAFPFDVAGRLPCIVNVTSHQKKWVAHLLNDDAGVLS